MQLTRITRGCGLSKRERILATLILVAILAAWFSFVFVSYDEDCGLHLYLE